MKILLLLSLFSCVTPVQRLEEEIRDVKFFEGTLTESNLVTVENRLDFWNIHINSYDIVHVHIFDTSWTEPKIWLRQNNAVIIFNYGNRYNGLKYEIKVSR